LAGRAADYQPWRYHCLRFPGVVSVETRDDGLYGQPGHSAGVLSDGGEVDMRQAGHAVVVPDDRDIRWYGDICTSEGVEQADGAAVVERDDGNG
jgi:hypothetical protein